MAGFLKSFAKKLKLDMRGYDGYRGKYTLHPAPLPPFLYPQNKYTNRLVLLEGCYYICYMKEIKLSEGDGRKNPRQKYKGQYVALVDDSDYEWLMQWKWRVHIQPHTCYAHTNIRLPNGKIRVVRMHRVVLGINNPLIIIDHRNRNGLDNQSDNLRVCTNSKNQANRISKPGSSSKYLGVSWHKRDKLWRAKVKKDGIEYRLGGFKFEKDAAVARDKKAQELHGSFAILNFPR